MSEVTFVLTVKEVDGNLVGTCQVKGSGSQTLGALADELGKKLPELIASFMNEVNKQEQSNASKH